MNRRSLMKSLAYLAGSLSLTSFLQACGLMRQDAPVPPSEHSSRITPASQTPQPTQVSRNEPEDETDEPDASPTPDPDSARIALLKTSDRAAGIRKVVTLLGINPAAGKHVLLKPNFNSADRPPGSTHTDTLHTMLAMFTEMGAASITIAERSGMGHTRSVMQSKDIFKLAENFNADVVVLDELADEDYTVINPSGSHWPHGFPVPNILLESDCVVQTCNLKTHQYGGHFTMALKNSVGFVAKDHGGHNYMTDLHRSPDQRLMIAEINTAYKPSLIVLDGVQAFIDGGPHAGTVADTEIILVGTDPVAVDALGVAALRLAGTTPEVSRGPIFEQEQIARAVELGLGVDSPSKIELLTADNASEVYAEQLRSILNN